MRQILGGLIRAYQYLLSPLLGPRCRFYPSCSHYAREALELHRLPAALWLITRRLLRCHPWHPGGLDPVPTALPHACGAASNAAPCACRIHPELNPRNGS